MDAESMSRRMSVSAVIALLSDRHGETTAYKMARLEQLKARRARSRKRFDFWTAVATQMQQERLGCEPAQNSNWMSGAARSSLPSDTTGRTAANRFRRKCWVLERPVGSV